MTGQVLTHLRSAAPECFEGTPVLFAYLYGSMATGRNRPGSDVDIAVYIDGEVDSLTLSLALSRCLADATGLGDVEVVVLNDAPLSLQGRAIRERMVIYSRDEPARLRYESRALREYFDFQIHAVPLYQQILDDTAKGLR